MLLSDQVLSKLKLIKRRHEDRQFKND